MLLHLALLAHLYDILRGAMYSSSNQTFPIQVSGQEGGREHQRAGALQEAAPADPPQLNRLTKQAGQPELPCGSSSSSAPNFI